MLTAEQGAALHGQIANALQDLGDGLVEVAKARLRRLQELVDDALPDVDGEGVRGCSCGEADHGAPGHDGHDDKEDGND